MKKIIILFTFVFSLVYCYGQKTEIIVIGNIHQAVPNYNSDTIVNILNKVQPDYLLQELDSSFFTQDFKFKEKASENEGIASEKYISKNPQTQMRPFEFEGRNEYRKINGFNPTEHLAISLLDSLYKKNLLTKQQNKIYKQYVDVLEPLKKAASGKPKDFNNSRNDKICEERQYYQYVKLLKIMGQRAEFSNHFYTKPNGKKITYEKGFQLASEFWDLRNQTMAKNILKIANENSGKKLVVLTGFMHRYYIISELKKLTKNNKNIAIKEFYEE
ncbi:MAG: hypothetical protein LC122_02840 [Chitinophagales bacterium]|nr:hypothetical protein [Chitinophagales bacterium]